MSKSSILSAVKNVITGKKNRIRKHNTFSRNTIKGKAPEKPAAAVRAASASRRENNDPKPPVKSNFRKTSSSAPHTQRRGNTALSLIKYPVFLINRFVCFIKNIAVKKRIIYISVAAALIVVVTVITVALAAGETPAYAVASLTDTEATNPVQAENLPGFLPTLLPTPVPTTEPEPSSAATPKRTDAPAPKPTVKPTPKPTTKPTPKPTQKPASADLNELVKYYQVEAGKYYSDYGYSSNHYEYTEDELRMLAQIITKEAGGERYEGQLAVGNVVMNRVFSKHWGSTIESVITAPKQFSYNPNTTPKSSCLKAAEDVLKNERWVVQQDVYFFNSGRTPGENWGSHKYYTKIGGHCFYTESIGRRHKGGDIPEALFDRTYQWPQYGCKTAKRVTRIQQMLAKLNYEVSTDGYFGKTTKDALIKFQQDKGLKADGVAGPSTIKALIKAYGINEYCSKYKD